jgi:hypothetical protein
MKLEPYFFRKDKAAIALCQQRLYVLQLNLPLRAIEHFLTLAVKIKPDGGIFCGQDANSGKLTDGDVTMADHYQLTQGVAGSMSSASTTRRTLLKGFAAAGAAVSLSSKIAWADGENASNVIALSF